MTALRYGIEATAVRVGIALAPLVPRRWLLLTGGALGAGVYHLDRRHRTITLDNLRQSLPELDPPARRRLARRCFRQLGRNVVDLLSLPRIGPDAIGRTIHYSGVEHLRQAYDEGHGVLLFSGHFGHWEITALMQGYLGLPLTLITRPLDNPALERLLGQVRTRSGNTVINKRDAAREMVRTLRLGRGVAIVIDQDAREHGIFVSFLGRPASTTPTLARMALRTGARVIPTFSLPRPDGSYLITYEPPVPVHPDRDRERETQRLTAACTSIIERWVRAHPEQWLWMHRRWKTAPPGSATTAGNTASAVRESSGG